MAYSCCFSLGGNLDFLEFLQKKFYNINYSTAVSKGLKCQFQFGFLNFQTRAKTGSGR